MTHPDHSIVGAVLAGGRSRRMGSSKAALRLEGRSLAERALEVLSRVFSDVVLSTSDPNLQLRGWRTITDRLRGRGPLGGLEAALRYAGGRSVFVLACDLPLVGPEIVRAIVSEAVQGAGPRDELDRARAWVALNGRGLQPLCGLYDGDCLAVVEENLGKNRLSMRELMSRIETTGVRVGESDTETLLNVNRPEDLERARRVLHDKK